ncbi:MAG: pyridoxal phosphate-dependent aminotransferase [Candidatus Delongbacteria bacterium]|jgi:aspartate/methionine/tyrosine aminotransferase|nr:pyridoxal phosphate-dependent aminotransferase [Candidatus Delongbacteria bacterium]
MAAHQSWISYFSNLVKEYGGINLAQGIPGFSPPSDLLDILQQTATQQVHQYAPGPGNKQLREHIYNMYQHKINRNETSLLVCNGATEAIHLLYMSFHEPGKKLKAAAFAPVYESYFHLPRLYGDMFQSLEMLNDEAEMQHRLEDFFEAYRPDVFFVNSPGNPHGFVLEKSVFDKLSDLSVNFGCQVIIDAVYDRLCFDGEAYYPFNKLSPNLFYVNSFSKLYSITGWRIGYFFCHHSIYNKISDIHDYTGLSAPSVLQESLARFMNESSQAINYVAETKHKLSENFKHAKTTLTNAGFNVPKTGGGYFIWAKLPDGMPDGIDFAKNLYDTCKTAVIPGEHFGKDYKRYIRINIARDNKELKNGLMYICSLT